MQIHTESTPVIWLLSAYRSDSHAAWADWLVDNFKTVKWHKLELPGRHFRWRIRGNPLSWLNKLPEENPSLILATSMVDLATLKGLHPRLANTPCLYYFHENQFAYPSNENQHDSIDPQMVQLYGAISANKLLFNSAYNRDSFLQGIDKLLKKLPDEIPPGLPGLLRDKSAILPVVINPLEANKTRHKNLILWNHRWEYDKAPQVFCDALIKLKQKGGDFQLALLGSRADKKPPALLQIEQQLGNHILINKKVSKEDYRKYLSQSSIVVSTAIHEFQGLSVLQAVTAGATPLVPDDLCYQEQYADMYRYKAGDSEILSEKLLEYLETTPAAPNVAYWHSHELIRLWYSALGINS